MCCLKRLVVTKCVTSWMIAGHVKNTAEFLQTVGVGKSMETFCLAVFLRWEKFNAMPAEGARLQSSIRGGSTARSKPLSLCIPF